MAILEAIRQAVSGLGRRGRGNAYPKGLRSEIVDYARARRSAGIPIETIGAELGMPWRTIRRWLPAVRGKRFRPIEIIATRREVVVHGPYGLRIEGLDVDGVAELVRRLG
jgi:transposase